MPYQTVRGMRDSFGAEERKRQYVIDTCRRVFEAYCFEPLETPALEELELLAKKGVGGAAIEGEIYSFKDKGDRDVGMRFDLTVPLARFVASNPQLPKPFKRYAIGKVWRYDRPQKGRYREFTQADIDVLGVRGMLAEFEVLSATIDVFKALGIDFSIRVNNRKLLSELAVKCGVQKDKAGECLRTIDKQGKAGWDGVRKELREKGISEKIVEILEKGGTLENVAKVAGKENEGAKELGGLFAMLKDAGIEKYVKFDVTLARGLDYYTGTTFEVMAGGMSCGGGGRYDNLVKLYGGQDTPAVGISYGIERLIEAAGSSMKMQKENARIFVIAVEESARKEALATARELRNAGASAEADLAGRNISKAMEYANKRGFSKVVVIGERELKEKALTVKDMKTGKEQKVKRGEIAKIATNSQ